VPARDRRTVSELPAESDAVSRETLLEVLTSQGPATARTWGQVVQSAARLWAVPLPISLAPTAGPGLLCVCAWSGRASLATRRLGIGLR
jgi:hypothetical protein